MDDNLKYLAKDIKTILAENERMRDLIMAIVEKNEISLADDEEF